MSSYVAKVTFTMSDGREFACIYPFSVTPGNYSGPPEFCYPDETEVGEPTYEIDGDEVDLKDLPKGLLTIAEAMYENGESDPRFRYSQKDMEPDVDYDDVDDSYYDDGVR